MVTKFDVGEEVYIKYKIQSIVVNEKSISYKLIRCNCENTESFTALSIHENNIYKIKEGDVN